MNNTRKLVFVGILIGVQVVLSRFFALSTPIVKVSFGFIPVSLAAMLYGPAVGGAVGGIADLIGATLFPSGPFFPGFTISGFLGGAIYGLILYQKPKTIGRVALATLLITLGVNLGLNSLWLYMLTKKASWAIMQVRAFKQVIVFPIQVSLIYLVWKYVGEKIKHEYLSY